MTIDVLLSEVVEIRLLTFLSKMFPRQTHMQSLKKIGEYILKLSNGTKVDTDGMAKTGQTDGRTTDRTRKLTKNRNTSLLMFRINYSPLVSPRF